jgi:hypothetical protein
MTGHDKTTANNMEPPLDARLAYMFEGEVLNQWDFAVRAFAIMNAALHQRDQETFWFGMDAGLGALGNISKIFFPPGTRSQTQRRGRQLRAAFGVGHDSLLQNRALRDAFEHFDERIDQWFRQSPRRNFADRLIGPAGMIQGIDAGDMFRHFNPETQAVSVVGDELGLQALIDEVQALVSRVAEQHKVIWWDRSPDRGGRSTQLRGLRD